VRRNISQTTQCDRLTCGAGRVGYDEGAVAEFEIEQAAQLTQPVVEHAQRHATADERQRLERGQACGAQRRGRLTVRSDVRGTTLYLLP